ncbi:MAG: hypothetical protein QNJ12_20520 [Ilumatobacter sp.]|uniref:hypothetical protein n=1 Tax=Ilumatobacter sp. TaxID=1967498 RepID=UPI00262A2F1E|nr:hypothetical protein [Ilumatobacter sp.]MDJ0771184.1 hypothetical protein [Ilumatobacter sp.]
MRLSRRLSLVGVLVALAVTASVDQAFAGEGDGHRDAVLESSVSDDEVTPPDDDDDEPPCWWRRSPANDAVAEVYNVVEHVNTIVQTILTLRRHEVTVVFYSERNTLHRYNEDDDTYEYQVLRTCRDGYTPGPDEPAIGAPDWWEATDPDPAILLSRTQVVTTVIEAPRPEMSPPPDAGAPVNLGLWIAVEEAGPYEAFATLGPRVWALRTATLAGITFDPGNGDVVSCTGRGTPLAASESDTIEAGPCGYVYTAYDDVIADLTASITARWEVTWELSDGRSGRDPDITTSVTFPYDVYEIQTVGTG